MGKFLWWRELRADGPPGADASRDSGRVPLSPQKNAKGGERGTQLACGSNKCPLPSNTFSWGLRGSQLPPPRRVRARRPVGAVYWRDEGRKRKGVEGEVGLAKAG